MEAKPSSTSLPVEDCEKEHAFGKILTRRDRNFEYDDRVLLPNDFEAYFNGLKRKRQQSLLSFVPDHDEAYRKLTGHKIMLPNQVQGWHLLKRAGLTREQRQMVTLKAPTLEKANVVEALFLLYGQDYKAGGWNSERHQDRSNSPSNKRPAPSTTTTEGMAVHSEAARGIEHPEATMLDPGASAFLSGYGPFKRYVGHGYPVNTIRFARCERLFQFGGDASSQARWTVNLPVMIDGSDLSSRPCIWALTSVASK